MSRWVTITCLIAAVCGAWTLSIPGQAYAYNNPGAYFTNDTGANQITGDFYGDGFYTPGGAGGANIPEIDGNGSRVDNLASAAMNGDAAAVETEETLATASADLGFMPALGTSLSILTLGVAAFATGYAIGRGIDKLYAYVKGDTPPLIQADRAEAERWQWGGWTRCLSTTGQSACYEAQVEDTSGNWQDRYAGEASGQACPVGSATYYCGLTDGFERLLQTPTAQKYTWPSPGASCAAESTYSGGCYSAYMAKLPLHAQAMESVASGGAAPSWMPTGTPIVSMNFTPPADAGSASRLSQARSDVDSSSAASAWVNPAVAGEPDPYAGGGGSPTQFPMPDCTGLTADQCETLLQNQGSIGTVTIETLTPAGANVDLPAGSIVSTDPAGGATVESTTGIIISVNPDAADMPFALPQPLANETYSDYIARLQALGWVGTATEIVLDSANADAATGPDGVVQINLVTANGTTTLVKRAYWPTTSIAVLKSAPITFSVNPPTEPPAPDPGPGPGETPGGTPSGAIDFTPITSIDPGCRFPYGFICYAKEVSDWFNVTPVAPSFNFTLGTTTGLGGEIGQHNFDVNLGDTRLNLDYYMGLIRDLESIVLWIGGVYFLATRLLGFTAGGDPGDVIDEAQPW